MIIESDIPKAKKIINKRVRKQIKTMGVPSLCFLLTFPFLSSILFGNSVLAGFLCTLIILVVGFLFFPFFGQVAINNLKEHTITLTENVMQIQFGRSTQIDVLWSDIKQVKLSDDTITVYLMPDAPHKHKLYHFYEYYTLDIAKIYGEIEQRWLSEKTV